MCHVVCTVLRTISVSSTFKKSWWQEKSTRVCSGSASRLKVGALNATVFTIPSKKPCAPKPCTPNYDSPRIGIKDFAMVFGFFLIPYTQIQKNETELLLVVLLLMAISTILCLS